MKLINVQAYPIKDVPDHLTHQCCELGKTILETVKPILKDNDPNIILGAMGFMFASTIKQCVSDDPEQLAKASKLYALGLLKNVEFLSNIQILEEEP